MKSKLNIDLKTFIKKHQFEDIRICSRPSCSGELPALEAFMSKDYYEINYGPCTQCNRKEGPTMVTRGEKAAFWMKALRGWL